MCVERHLADSLLKFNMAEFDRVLCIKPEVFVYRIPARTTNRGYRADEWKLDEPAWTGRMRLIANGDDLTVKLEDKHNGELFAQGKLDGYPGLALEKVLDSSRYFVLRIEDSGRHAFVGVGFADRSDAFDLIVNIQDHFKFLKRNEKEAAAASSPQDAGPKLDLGFKEGQTITINLGDRKPRPAAKKRPTGGAVPGLLPPPPGGVKIPGPPRSTSDSPVPIIPPANDIHTSASQSSANTVAGLDDLLNLDIGSSEPPAAAPSATLAQTQPSADPWGDFASAKPGQQQQQQQQLQGNNLGGPWVQF